MTPISSKRQKTVTLVLIAGAALAPALAQPRTNAPAAVNDITQLKAGQAAFEAHRFDQALQSLYRFRDQCPNNLAVHFWLATTLAALGRDQDAQAEYINCLNLAASVGLDSAEMRNNLANDIVRGGHLNESLFDYKRAIFIDPRCAPPYLGLAKCLIEKGSFDEALITLDNYQRYGGQDINAILLHGLALAGKDQYEQASQDLTNFVNAAENGGYYQPRDKDLTCSKLKYITTGGANPATIDLAKRILNEMHQRH